MRPLTFLAPVLATVALGACARSGTRAPSGEAQMVSLVVRSEPPGARVRVGRLIKTWITPCDIADFGITKGMLDLDISLEGYDSVTPRVYYDGEHPVKVDAKLVSRRPPAPAPEAATPTAPTQPSAATEGQAGIQIRVEPVQGGIRLTVSPPRGRVRITSGMLMTDGDRGGIYFLANVPPEKAVVEVLDPVTDAVLQVLTIPGTSSAPAPAAVAPAPAPASVYAVPQTPAPTYYAAPAAPPQTAPAPTYYYVPASVAAPAAAPPTYYYVPVTQPQAAPAPTYYYVPVVVPR